MLRLSRPDKPTGFDDAVNDAKDAVRRAVRMGKKPVFDVEVLRDYKAELVYTQQGRCAYCERRLSDVGHLEHFRPKARITRLYDDPETWGTEGKGLRFTGRKWKLISKPGYHWLAYSWDNFNASCDRCNSAKGTLFPVEDEDGRVLPPRKDVSDETPLLLDPYEENPEPAEHLEFGPLGAVQARSDSRHGFETVRTLALDRQSFRDSRQDIASKVYACIHKLKDRNESQSRQALEDLLHLGRAEPAANHPGMVRIIVEQELLMTWSEFQGQVGTRTP